MPIACEGERAYFQQYDSTVSLYTTENHKTIRKGDSELFLLETFITAPMAGLQFVVKQPLGYTVRILCIGLVRTTYMQSITHSHTLQDYFHIGNVGIEMGNAFACSINVPGAKYSRSPSGLIVNSVSFETVLVNRDGNNN